MENRDPKQNEGGRKDHQPETGNPGKGNDDEINTDPRKMREQDEHSRYPGQNRPKESPDQSPKP